MAAQKQDDQLERTFSSYVRIQVVVLKTYLGRWTIGRSGERGSGISVLPARYDDDDDSLYIYIYIYICVYVFIVYIHIHIHWICVYIYIYIYIYIHQGEWVAPSSTPLYSSYWQGNLGVTLNYGCQLTKIYIYIYIYIYIHWMCIYIYIYIVSII